MSGVIRLGASIGCVLGIWLLCLGAHAEVASATVSPTAHDIVRSVSERVMILVDESSDYVEDDPDRYYRGVHEILDPVIDYRGFARSVMGPYGTGERYRSLNEEGRAQLRDQLGRFTDVIKDNLVSSYGSALLAFAGARIEVAQPTEEELQQSVVAVRQLIYTADSEPYTLLYQMGLNKQKQWKLRNVIAADVGLGEIYQEQFKALAREHDGDLDRVIDNWSTVEQEG